MKLTEVFGSNVFNDKIMKERLPKEAYKGLKETIEKGTPLQSDVANVVANAMKDWAIEKGATHYTHWFVPLTGTTAEKHDSFLNPAGDGQNCHDAWTSVPMGSGATIFRIDSHWLAVASREPGAQSSP